MTHFGIQWKVWFLSLLTLSAVRVTNMLEKPHYKKPTFQALISRILLDTETRGRVFRIALGPVTICIPIGTIGLLYVLQYRMA